MLQSLLPLAVLAAKRAGEAALAVYHGHIEVEYKDDRTPLTMADKQAHAIILERLGKASRPSMPVLSEEGKQTPYEERSGWEFFWLVDPLDGTKEFIKRRGEFTVNIALIHRQTPVLGVVLVPARNLLYFAAADLGAFRLEQPEALSPGEGKPGQESLRLAGLLERARRLPLPEAALASGGKLTVVGSRSHATAALAAFVERLKQQQPQLEFTPAGSALKFALIAEGSADIYPRFSPTMEWDTAAGQCLVEQSGGKVLRLADRKPMLYNKSDLHNPHFVCFGGQAARVAELRRALWPGA